MALLFEAQTGDGNSAEHEITYDRGIVARFDLTFVLWGTWDGASIAIEYSPPGQDGIWVPLDDGSSRASYAQDTVRIFRLPHAGKIRGVQSSSGAGTSLNMGIF